MWLVRVAAVACLIGIAGACATTPHAPVKTYELEDVTIVPSNVPLLDRPYVRESRRQTTMCETVTGTIDVNSALTTLGAGADALVQIVTQRKVERTWDGASLALESVRVCYDVSAYPIRYLPESP